MRRKVASPKLPMIACYCRVSSESQKSDSQRAEIQQRLSGQQISPEAVAWYEDVESGATLDRPAFAQLQQAIFRGAVATLVVWKLDRIARNMRDSINLLADWCEQGLRMVSVTEQIDLSGTVKSRKFSTTPDNGGRFRRNAFLPYCFSRFSSPSSPRRLQRR